MRRRAAASSIVILVPLAVWIVQLQRYWLSGPLDRDLSVYFVVAHRLLSGETLYRTIWDHKPPAIHLAFAGAELLFGYSKGSILFLGAGCAIGTLIAIFFLVRSAAGWLAGTLAALVWACLALSPAFEANQPNTEPFISLLSTIGIVLWLSRSRSAHKVAAIAFSAATLFKPVAILLPLGLAAGLLLAGELSLREGIRRLLWLLIATLAAWGLTAGWFALHGDFEAFYRAVFLYNSHYSGSVSENLAGLVETRNLLPLKVRFIAPILYFVALSALLQLWWGARGRSLGLIGACLGALIAIALPGRFYLHYYQLILPPLILLFGASLAPLRPPVARLRAILFPVAALAVALVGKVELLSPTRAAPGLGDPLFNQPHKDAQRVGEAIGGLLKPGDAVYEFGAEPAIYYFAKTEPFIPVLHYKALLEGPDSTEFTKRTLAVLEERVPRWVVVEDSALADAGWEHPIIAWFRREYRASEAVQKIGSFQVLERIDRKVP